MTAAAEPLTALITGGTRGIGRAVAFKLVAQGFSRLIINYARNDGDADETRAAVERLGAACSLIRANLMSLDEIDRLRDELRNFTPRLDILVHCAALNAFKPLSEVKPNQWDLVMNVNTRGFLMVAQKAAPMFNRGGSIIAISSVGAVRVLPNYGAMGPAKAAMESVIRYLAVELAPLGIRVNGVSAGLVATASLDRFPNSAALLEEAVSRTPSGRISTGEDIASVVCFLASPEASQIRGQIINVDGGLSLY